MRGTYDTNSQIKFKTTLVKSSLCDYSDAYIHVKETITFTGQGADTAAIQADRNNKPYLKILKINNTQVDKKNHNTVISLYNLVEYNDNYSLTMGSLWQYHR